jgi:hypothetical protein
VFKKTGFPASSAGQALLEFIPMKIGAGMTNPGHMRNKVLSKSFTQINQSNS